MLRFLLLALFCVAPVAAQRDFLTADEVDRLREAQEPDDRIRLYLLLARQRVDLVAQLFAKEKAGRSILIHDTLDQYTQIIDAMNTVVDDALAHKRTVTVLPAMAKTERELLAKLQKLSEIQAADKERYQFSLEQAVERYPRQRRVVRGRRQPEGARGRIATTPDRKAARCHERARPQVGEDRRPEKSGRQSEEAAVAAAQRRDAGPGQSDRRSEEEGSG